MLGDRIRMQAHFLDPGVFIRSLATPRQPRRRRRARRATSIRLLDAFGMDAVLVETVGVGQTELDVMRLADTIVVVLVPEAGDTVQVMKAGLLEIADVFVVNKADREGAERMQSELRADAAPPPAVAVDDPGAARRRPRRRRGIDERARRRSRAHRALVAARRRARAARARRAASGELLDILDEELRRRLERGLGDRRRRPRRRSLESVRGGDVDPYSAALRILDDAPTLERLLGRR